MVSRKHFLFNVLIILIPWLSLLFIGKRNVKRYSLAGMFVIVFEILNHLYGRKRNWWKFYDKPKWFMRDELPFNVGPYMPLTMWILKYSYGNFKKFILLNVLADGIFAFIVMDFLKKMKIVRLHRLNPFQFFIYIHYKAYLIYAVQYLYEKIKNPTGTNNTAQTNYS
ncbi:hypothetical protein [Alkalihalobacterium chitinilyticum]|uniref:Uncharacterized protein n=1 Tax=Alkalihalobacterium chitinilyticum TaxID=2980103 RepID=A0ABT5VNQ9_9BACI|nr:hypothetical protein [Alkalihalobacterium chitinilyticum]MDE5416128.1 hypothetical protein [Alkalihalobacterium chitinilyticum]